MNDQERLRDIAQQFINSKEWPSLKGVIANWENETLKISFFCEEISNQMMEDASILATEILAQFSEGLLEEKFIYWESSQSLPMSPFWVYRKPK